MKNPDVVQLHLVAPTFQTYPNSPEASSKGFKETTNDQTDGLVFCSRDLVISF